MSRRRRADVTRGWLTDELAISFVYTSATSTNNNHGNLIGYTDVASDDDDLITGDKGAYFVQRTVLDFYTRFTPNDHTLAGSGNRRYAWALVTYDSLHTATLTNQTIFSHDFDSNCVRVLQMGVADASTAVANMRDTSSGGLFTDAALGSGAAVGLNGPGPIVSLDISAKYGFGEEQALGLFVGIFGALGGSYGWSNGDTLTVNCGYRVLLQRRRR